MALSPAIEVLMDSWDELDPFGSAMEAGWAVAVVSRAIEFYEPAHTLNYRPSPVMREYTLDDIIESSDDDDNVTLSMKDLAHAVKIGAVTEPDLAFAARVLSRYVGILSAAGLDY